MIGHGSRRVAEGLACIALVLAGCGGDDSSDATDNEDPEVSTTAPDGGNDEGEESPAELVEWSSERVADLESLSISSVVPADDAIVGISRSSSDQGFTTSLVRVETDGSVGAPVEISSDVMSIGSLFSTEAGVFVTGSRFADGASACGYAPLDTTALTPGEIVSLTPEGTTSCSSGTPTVIDGSTATFTTLEGIAVADTATGDVEFVDVAADYPDYRAGQVIELGGSYFVSLDADYDADTGDQNTAADGSPLPGVVVRVDTESLEVVASGEVTGFLTVSDGNLFAQDYGDPVGEGEEPQPPVVVAVDPETLETTDADPEDAGSGCSSGGFATSSGELAWFNGQDEFVGVDRSSCERVATAASVEIDGETDDTFRSPVFVGVGDDVYVLTTLREATSAEGSFDAPPVATVLDRLSPP